MDSDGLDEALETIANTKNIEDLSSALSDLREIYHLSHLAYCATRIPALAGAEPYIVATYPTEWLDLYKKENYFAIDPVYAASQVAFLPLDWAEIDQSSSGARHVFDRAQEHGIGRQGMSLAMRGPHGDAAGLVFTADLPAEQWSAFKNRAQGEITIVAQHFHDRLMRLLTDSRRVERPSPLTERERECLQMLADGKPPKQIAIILELSEAAVRLYLKGARAKLGTTTSMQAAFTAIREGYIEQH